MIWRMCRRRMGLIKSAPRGRRMPSSSVYLRVVQIRRRSTTWKRLRRGQQNTTLVSRFYRLDSSFRWRILVTNGRCSRMKRIGLCTSRRALLILQRSRCSGLPLVHQWLSWRPFEIVRHHHCILWTRSRACHVCIQIWAGMLRPLLDPRVLMIKFKPTDVIVSNLPLRQPLFLIRRLRTKSTRGIWR
jgi:hypothetical protein